MPKTYIAKIVVPSGSRAPNLFKWLGTLLGPHGMAIQTLQTEDGSEGISEPGVALLPLLSTPTLHSEVNKDRTRVEDKPGNNIVKVHVSEGRRTLCGIQGRAPKGERWVSSPDVGTIKQPEYLCEECREFLT